jgi:hypothetical protein
MTDIIYYISEKTFIKKPKKLIIEVQRKGIKSNNAGVRFLVELLPENWEEIGHFVFEINFLIAGPKFPIDQDEPLIEQKIIAHPSLDLNYQKDFLKMKSAFEEEDIEDLIKKLKRVAAPLLDIV